MHSVRTDLLRCPALPCVVALRFAARQQRLLRADKKRRRALKAKGIDYEFGGYAKAVQSAGEAGGAAAVGIKKARHVKL